MKKQLAAVVGCITVLTGTGIQLPAAAQTLTAETLDYYTAWKEAYLRKNPYITDEDQYYVFYGEQTYEQAQETVPVTVSEAHGYGMLIAAMMSGYDPDAKDIFDGMYRYYLAHPSSIGPHLMAWQQSDNGESLIDTDGTDSATDGDLDIAYSLLLADSLWGSGGTINYLQAAKLMIADIMEYEINHVRWTPQLGDWAHRPGEENIEHNPGVWGGAGGWSSETEDEYPYTGAVRTSDLILQYFPVFAEVTGDEHWTYVYNACNGIVHYQTTYTKYGLLPDFFMPNHTGGWSYVPPNFLEGDGDGSYSYNACRTPWRIGTDALLWHNEEAQIYAEMVNACIKEDCGGDPKQIKAGYDQVWGRANVSWSDLCFTAPLMISAAAAGDTEFHDAIRKEVLEIGVDSYYGNTIAMLCLITDDGGWLMPDREQIPGDINHDFKTDIADIYALRGFLLADRTVLNDWRAGDLNGDGRLDAVDYALLRRLVLRLQGSGQETGTEMQTTAVSAPPEESSETVRTEQTTEPAVPEP